MSHCPSLCLPVCLSFVFFLFVKLFSDDMVESFAGRKPILPHKKAYSHMQRKHVPLVSVYPCPELKCPAKLKESPKACVGQKCLLGKGKAKGNGAKCRCCVPV